MSVKTFLKNVGLFFGGIITGIVSFIFISRKRGNTVGRAITDAEQHVDNAISGISSAEREQRTASEELGRISDIAESERRINSESSDIIRENAELLGTIGNQLEECSRIVESCQRKTKSK